MYNTEKPTLGSRLECRDALLNSGITVEMMNKNLGTEYLEEYEKYPYLTKYRNGYVDFGEFLIYKFFDSASGDTDIQNSHLGKEGVPVVGASQENYGVAGYTTVEARVFSPMTLTVDMFGNVRYRGNDYKMVTHSRVFSLSPIFKEATPNVLKYMATCIQKGNLKYSWSNICTFKKIEEHTMKLPVTPEGEPDYEFMEALITETIVRSLGTKSGKLGQGTEFSLSYFGLPSYSLTPKEKQQLEGAVITREFKLDDLFYKVKVTTPKIPASYLPENATGENILPLKTSGNKNRGLTRYAPTDCGATILKNEITVAANGNPKAYYISGNFGVLQDAYAIKWKYDNWELPTLVKLYLETAINHILVGRYDWVKKSGWNNLKKDFIALPVTPEGEPDYEYMEKFMASKYMEKVEQVEEFIANKYK